MRILLQHKGTGLYLREAGAWSDHSTEALDFVSSTAAIEFCAVHHVSQVQLVLKFEEEQHDIVLPLVPGTDSPTDRPHPTL